MFKGGKVQETGIQDKKKKAEPIRHFQVIGQSVAVKVQEAA